MFQATNAATTAITIKSKRFFRIAISASSPESKKALHNVGLLRQAAS
jgi:hypothetical protein